MNKYTNNKFKYFIFLFVRKCMLIIFISFSVLVYAGFYAGSMASDEKWREEEWMERGKESVKAKLKDPNSAQFRNVFFSRQFNNTPMTCGEVNSKNSFGGYGGYMRFISAGKPKLTFLEEEVSDFPKLWRSTCN